MIIIQRILVIESFCQTIFQVLRAVQGSVVYIHETVMEGGM